MKLSPIIFSHLKVKAEQILVYYNVSALNNVMNRVFQAAVVNKRINSKQGLQQP